MKVNDNTSISMPIRNMLAIIAAVAVGAWAYFGVIERLNKLETSDTLFQADLLKKAEQEPKNLEMYMLIEHLASQIESIEKEIDASRYNKVNRNPSLAQNENFTLLVSKCRGVIPQAIETETMPTGSLWDELKEDYIKENPESKTLDNNNSTLKIPPEGYIMPLPKPKQ